MRLLFAGKYIEQLKIELQNERECAARPWVTRSWSCEDRCIIDRGRDQTTEQRNRERREYRVVVCVLQPRLDALAWVEGGAVTVCMHTVTAPPSTQAIADQGLEMQRSVVLLRWMDIDRGRDKTTEQSH
jgi:hypothetical protein